MPRYSVIIRIVLLWKYLKLKLFFVYGYWFHALCVHLDKSQTKIRLPTIRAFSEEFKKAYGVLCNSKKAIMYDGCSYNIKWRINRYGHAIPPILYKIVGTLWVCEKAGINAKFFTRKDGLQTLFDIPRQSSCDETSQIFCPVPMVKYTVSPKIAYKLSEKLPVRKELRNEADEWFNKHVKGNWVAVHYRGTDAVGTHRYKIELEPYINYLKVVLDNKCSIFVCSDQAQFIDKMQVAFPGRVFARNIQRSSSKQSLHRTPDHKGTQQKDALIDMLILAKANLIYTNGSAFVDSVRFFNPKTKIVSLDGRRIGGCQIPIPQKDVFDSLKIK